MNRYAKIYSKTRSVIAAGMLAGMATLSIAGAASGEEFDKAGIETIVREYLLQNPEILIDMQRSLETKQEQIKQQQQMATLKEKHDLIYNSPNQMIIGNPEAKISIVEFFDYNCGYCKRALSDMQKIVGENPDVKFIMKEFPVLGEPSLEAHKISLAFIKRHPEKYADFHNSLLSAEGRKDGNSALELAVSMGADADQLKADANDPAIIGAIGEVYDLADGLGITGTPSYVIGEEVVFGAVGFDRLMPKIAQLQKVQN